MNIFSPDETCKIDHLNPSNGASWMTTLQDLFNRWFVRNQEKMSRDCFLLLKPAAELQRLPGHFLNHDVPSSTVSPHQAHSAVPLPALINRSVCHSHNNTLF
jgi:hypothetical protein